MLKMKTERIMILVLALFGLAFTYFIFWMLGIKNPVYAISVNVVWFVIVSIIGKNKRHGR